MQTADTGTVATVASLEIISMQQNAKLKKAQCLFQHEQTVCVHTTSPE